MKLIFGLGNPGREYAGTRHNTGFDTITRLSDATGIPLDYKKHKGLCGKGVIEGERVVLIQPLTYMNLSGECVREAIDFYKLTNEDIIVVYDDCSMDIGQLRIRLKGSAGGHNGIKSIIQHLGTDEFTRIKVGIGEKPAGWDLADYVLGRFKDEDNDTIREAIGRAADAVKKIIVNGPADAMNEYNRRPEDEAKKAEKLRLREEKRKAAAEKRVNENCTGAPAGAE